MQCMSLVVAYCRGENDDFKYGANPNPTQEQLVKTCYGATRSKKKFN